MKSTPQRGPTDTLTPPSSSGNGSPAQPITPEKVDLKALKERSNTILFKSLLDPNPLIRSLAIEIVTELNRTDAMPTVIKLLRDDEVMVRFTATVAVGDMKYDGGILSVKRLLRDENASVRIAAGYALTKLGEDHFDMIVNQLKSPNPVDSANAAMLLGKLGNKKAARPLLSVLSDDNSKDLARVQAVVSIAMLGVDKGLTYQRLWALLISNMADNKIMGIQGMRYLGTKEAQDALTTILAVDDEQTRLFPEIRLYAAQQLAQMGNDSGKDYVLEYLKVIRPQLNSEDANRADNIAALAIGYIGDMELAGYLPRMIRSENKDLSLRAAEAVLLFK